jgi:hypothetical protein
VSLDTATSPAPSPAALVRPRRHAICVWVSIAALANVLIPAVFFSESHYFGHTDARYRALIAAVVLAEYAVVFLLLLFHANVGFASGYAVSTAAIVTLGSAGLALLTLNLAAWDWKALYSEALVLAGIAFAVISNVIFFSTSIRYARAIHPRLHPGGFTLGVAASLALLFLYIHMLP